MIEFLRGWTINIVTLVIFIVLLEILVPSGKMKKYINLISGFLIMITLITPFLKFIQKEQDLKGLEFSETVNINKIDIDQKSKLLSKNQSKQIIEVYRQKIITQLESYIKQNEEIESVKADVTVDEDSSSEKYGEIKRVYMSLNLKKSREESNTEIKMIPKVEKIQVGPGSGIWISNAHQISKSKTEYENNVESQSVDSKNIEGSKIDNRLNAQLKKKINELLGVEEENIIITCGSEGTKAQR
ncbi:MAG TPA: stage III sporulation protein AF [Pseudobacteroides sp.]|uniref:stage III sporulation protein AF n=1 Tax=Pseudobacteroides sp. TaxID=1968840 RepID=UPI002F95A60B